MIYLISPGGRREKGGMGRVVDTIAGDLASHCPELPVAVVDTYGPGPFHLMPFHFAAALGRLAWAFAAGRAQLAHVHMAEYGSVLRKGLVMGLATLFRVPVVLHLHGGRFPEQYRRASRPLRWALRRVIGMAGEVVVLGETWRSFVEQEFAGCAGRVTVLHNAVPGPAVMPPRPEGGPVRLLFLGRLVPLKGLSVLFEALAGEALRARDWTLTIGGDGDLDRYRAEVERFGLADRVRFAGWLDREGCAAALGAAQVVVQPSFTEVLPMAVLEAMAHGLAIVATPVGNVPDAIAAEETGLLVPPGDPAALAAALCRVIDDAALRERLGAGARARFEAAFDVTAYRGRLLELYRRNARRWPAPRGPVEPASV